MEILVASESGVCFGVRRALKLAMEALDRSDRPIFSLGPLIHNPQEVDRLTRRGLIVVPDLDAVQSGTIIFRSHGVHPNLVDKAKRKKLCIVDATCPFVRKAQCLAQKLHEEDYTVVIIGEGQHSEVKSLIGFAGGQALVVPGAAEAAKIPQQEKIGVIPQTTQSHENFIAVVTSLLLRSGEVRVFNTICQATYERQKEARELARRVGLMLVVGGYNSANTRRLAEICSDTGTETHHLEEAAEIDPKWLIGKSKVGVTAGASTPDWVIEKVVNKLKNKNKM